MQIGVSSYSFARELKRGMTYFEACDQAAEMGYRGIEFIDLEPQYGAGITDIEELAVRIREHCERLSLAIPAYTISADFLNGRGCAPEEELERVQRCVDIAVLLGAKVMRHDAFWHMDGLRDWREAVEKIAPAIAGVARYAAARGIVTCSENHGLIMQDSERVETLIRSVNEPNYGWLVDIGNFLCADEDPQHAVGIAAPYAVHAHVKDFLFRPGQEEKPGGHWLTTRGGNYLRGTVVGHGVVPVRSCIRQLRAAGYNGWLSVEFEGAEETLPALRDAIEYLHRIGAEGEGK
ncbi:MAG: sugar phosphate isomerase/epimerase [Clostridia bacterium]|nr:sugar phosphate isomerase/epimerase [Clostridia bacterium]